MITCARHSPADLGWRRLERIARWAAGWTAPSPPVRYDLLLDRLEDMELALLLDGHVDDRIADALDRAKRVGIKTEEAWRSISPPGISWQRQLAIRMTAWEQVEAQYDAFIRSRRAAGGYRARGGRPPKQDAHQVARAKRMMAQGAGLRAAAAAVGMSSATLSRRLRDQ